MMKRDFGRSLIAVTIATLGSTAGILGAPRPPVVTTNAGARGSLGVRIRFRIERTIPIRRIAAQVKDETEAIWRPYGIQLEWVDADTVEPRATGASLDVTVERRDRRAGRIESASTTLGRTIVGPDTRGWRPIHVSFDAVANVLADGATSHLSGTGLVLDVYLSRALGRVLAHEIGHALTNAAQHDRSGLMRATFSADELAQPNRSLFRLTCATVDRLNDRFHIVAGASSIAPIETDVCIR